MQQIQQPVPYLLADVIAQVKAAVLPALQAHDANIQTLHYEYGTWEEIIETLKQYDQSRTKRFEKYPLVALIHNFPEKRGDKTGYYGEVELLLVIAHHTEAQYKAAERYQKSFVPVLYPIYQELLHQIARSPAFAQVSVDSIRHTKADMLHWGRSTLYSAGPSENQLTDHIDAIEVRGLQLTVKKTLCSPLNSNALWHS